MKPDLEVQFDPAQVRETSLRTYLIRFAFGGAVTALAGLVAHFYGPVVGGLFLAFPGILPASATLIERHDGRRAAGAGAYGAAFGGLGLLAFGAVVWTQTERLPAWIVLPLATVAWLAASVILWTLFRLIRRAHRAPAEGPKQARQAT